MNDIGALSTCVLLQVHMEYDVSEGVWKERVNVSPSILPTRTTKTPWQEKGSHIVINLVHLSCFGDSLRLS